jgi:hypothetical protein
LSRALPYTPQDVLRDTSVPLAMEALNGLLHPCRAGCKSALWVGADSDPLRRAVSYQSGE